jgi:hypothetical protein
MAAIPDHAEDEQRREGERDREPVVVPRHLEQIVGGAQVNVGGADAADEGLTRPSQSISSRASIPQKKATKR